MQKLYIVLSSVASASVAILISALTILSIPSKDYDLRIEAITSDEGGIFHPEAYSTSKLSIENTGKMPLTNVTATYIEIATYEQAVSLQVSDEEKAALKKSIQQDGGGGRAMEFVLEHKGEIDGVGVSAYGSSDVYFFKNAKKENVIGTESVKMIIPHEKVYLSPPSGSSFVLVIADHGVNATSKI